MTTTIEIKIIVERMAMSGRRAVIEISAPTSVSIGAVRDVVSEATFSVEGFAKSLGIEPWEAPPDVQLSANGGTDLVVDEPETELDGA